MISRWNSVLEKNKVENNNKQTSKKSLSSNPLLGAASNPIVDKIVKTVAPKKTEETTKKITGLLIMPICCRSLERILNKAAH